MPTSDRLLERELDVLTANAGRWARMTVPQKRRLLAEVLGSVAAAAAPWAAAGAAAKGTTGTPAAGEEWMSGPWAVLYALRRYLRTLDHIAATGSPHVPSKSIRSRGDGRTVVDVFPMTLADRFLFAGISAEVWMDDGVTPQGVRDALGIFYRQPDLRGRTALVMGAGNISSIGPLDVLYKLVAGGAVCMLKLSPVNAYLAPIFARALAPLIREGFLRVVTGDADVGSVLAAHAAVDEVHVTGSARAYDALAAHLRKPLTGELGNVTPTIIVPGPWSRADIAFAAEHVLTQKLHNGGFNCVAAQILVLPEDWEGTPPLLAEIQRLSTTLSARPQYYPGAEQRRAALLATRRPAGGGAATIVEAERGDVGFGSEAFATSCS
ncbi:MAG TPA: aldehyde dehydrogenase family protein [Candidatus Baltobacteraceae bacterium]